MSLKELLEEGRLEQRTTSKQEIFDLLNVASRSLGDERDELCRNHLKLDRDQR